MDRVVKSGADIQQIYNQAAKSRLLILLAGTNDKLKGTPQTVCEKMKTELQSLNKSRPVYVTTIPPQHDVPHDNLIHYDLANSYIREIVLRMDEVYLIDLYSFQRFHFTKQGLHLK